MYILWFKFIISWIFNKGWLYCETSLMFLSMLSRPNMPHSPSRDQLPYDGDRCPPASTPFPWFLPLTYFFSHIQAQVWIILHTELFADRKTPPLLADPFNTPSDLRRILANVRPLGPSFDHAWPSHTVSRYAECTSMAHLTCRSGVRSDAIACLGYLVIMRLHAITDCGLPMSSPMMSLNIFWKWFSFSL